MECEKAYQLELFKVADDDRIHKLREMFRLHTHLFTLWTPNVKEIERMAKSRLINGSKIIEVYQEEKDKFVKNYYGC